MATLTPHQRLLIHVAATSMAQATGLPPVTRVADIKHLLVTSEDEPLPKIERTRRRRYNGRRMVGRPMTKPATSLVEAICNAYSDSLAADLRGGQARPCRAVHQNIEELERAYAIGRRDGAIMRERKLRLDAGVRACR